jgi:hypothetical protein
LISALLVAGLLYVVLGSGSGPKKAVIVDQLSLTVPNAEFVEKATSTLEAGGYTVDYYPGEEVTVDFYRTLPTHGYDFIVFRVHSGLVREIDPTSEERTLTDYVSLFSGEPFSETKYSSKEEAGRLGLGMARYHDGGPAYFGITPRFIESTMEGGFDDATIVLMGCDGLLTTKTAEAFVSKGAETFISWSQPVLADRTDDATERLLEYLLIDDLTTQDALRRTMADVGPDPTYGSVLRSYPN